MSAPTPAPGDDRPREGYYPDPSIPGYVRYWNGSSWVPGTSRPAPAAGEPLAPPAGGGPAPGAVEETGPHFFDEDPAEEAPHPDTQHGSRPEPASAWGADRTHQGASAATRTAGCRGGPRRAPGRLSRYRRREVSPRGRTRRSAGRDRRISGCSAGCTAAGWSAGRRPEGGRCRPGRRRCLPGRPDGQAARTDGTAAIPPAEPDEDGGTRVFRRPTAGSGEREPPSSPTTGP